MTEICVESNEACEPMKRTAMRRRTDLRRFDLAGVAGSMASSDETKRRKNERSGLYLDSDSYLGLDPSPRYWATSVCGRRRDMEDAVSIKMDFLVGDLKNKKKKHQFFGVFDGHGCSHGSNARVGGRGSREFSTLGAFELEGGDGEELCSDGQGGGGEARRRCGEQPNCRCELLIPKCDHVGSTAVVAVVNSDRIVVANCGDSRAVLGRKGSSLPLSLDHKPDRPDELNRIETAGGRVIYWDGARVLGVLAMSRAIGDGHLKPFVIPEPAVTITERTGEDECLILASDGLWDVVSNETGCDVVRVCLKVNNPAGDGEGLDKACSDAAMLLTKLALARRSADNVSVVVVDLRRNL